MTDPPHAARRRPVASIVDSHPAGAFFVLAFALSWLAWVPALLVVPDATSVVMIPGAFGPALAAATVTRLRGESVRDWLADRLDPHAGRRWYAAALGVPLGLALALGVALVALGGQVDPARLGRGIALYPVTTLSLALLGGGQEELGWRGFALPALQERFDAATASVAIGIAWAGWHLPAFAFEVPGYTGSFPRYALLVVGVSVVLTWLYNGAGGSVLPAMLLHGGVNAAPTLGVAVAGGPSAVEVSPYAVLVPAVWVVALALVLRYGRETLSADPALTNAPRSGTDVGSGSRTGTGADDDTGAGSREVSS